MFSSKWNFYNLFKNDLNFFKKYIIFIFSLTVLISLVLVSNVISIIKSYSYYVKHQMEYNIYEYNEVDLEQLCRLSNCSFIICNIDEKNYETSVFMSVEDPKKGIKLIRTLPTESIHMLDLNYINEGVYFSFKYGIMIYVHEARSFFAIGLDLFFKELKTTYIVTYSFLVFVVVIFLFNLYKKEERDHALQALGSEAILSNQSMILITENVHHEMNTPLEVIDNKIEKIHRMLLEYLRDVTEKYNQDEVIDECTKVFINKLVKAERDFEFIKLASEQIFTTLDKMRGFKHLRYSNGNKTIQDITEGALKILSISNSGYEYIIDDKLRDFRIKPQGSKTLKNVDLLNVFINHIKNSLEAKAHIIEFKLHKFEIDDKVTYYREIQAQRTNDFSSLKDGTIGRLFIHIIDNGNGIPDSAIHSVFDENFSTKLENGSTRGNGMFLNRFILRSSSGDIRVKETSKNGTVIELEIPVKYIEKQYH